MNNICEACLLRTGLWRDKRKQWHVDRLCFPLMNLVRKVKFISLRLYLSPKKISSSSRLSKCPFLQLSSKRCSALLDHRS